MTGVRGRILLPVLLVGAVSLSSEAYFAAMIEADHKEIISAQRVSLEMVGFTMDANTNLTRVNLIVTQTVGSSDMDAAVRDELLRELDLNINRIHLALGNYNHRTIHAIDEANLRSISRIVDAWHVDAKAIIENALTRENWRVAEFIERNGQLTHSFSVLLDRAHQQAINLTNEVERSTAAREQTAMLVVFVVTSLVLAFALVASTNFASSLRHVSNAMRALADGDLDAKINVTDRRDELGDLSRSLEVFRTAMRNVVNTKATMEQMALTDALTGLANRRGLAEFFSICGNRPGAAGSMMGVLHIDLDHFKTVNDTLGHEAGDVVLKEASDRMLKVIRRNDLLARIGGDEFVVILPDLPEQSALEALCNRIIAQFETPIIFEETSCTIGASIGAVHVEFEPGKTELEELLQNADVALCEVKAAGRNAYKLFDTWMGRRREEQANAARDIARGLAFDEFTVHFQPIVDTQTNAVTGAELLARWQHPEHGLMLPESFLGPAEAYKLLEDLGTQVLERACEAVREIRMSGQDLPVLHLNLNRSQVLSNNMIDQMSWRLDAVGISPQSLAIEVSERVCISRGAEAVIAKIARLCDLGHPLVLDSFGQDVGAIRVIAQTRAGQVKICREIFEGAEDGMISGDNQVLVRSAISTGENLGISVVAKGVETELQIEAMHALGITELQGDVIAPPMPPQEFARWLSTREIVDDYTHQAILARPKIGVAKAKKARASGEG